MTNLLPNWRRSALAAGLLVTGPALSAPPLPPPSSSQGAPPPPVYRPDPQPPVYVPAPPPVRSAPPDPAPPPLPIAMRVIYAPFHVAGA